MKVTVGAQKIYSKTYSTQPTLTTVVEDVRAAAEEGEKEEKEEEGE